MECRIAFIMWSALKAFIRIEICWVSHAQSVLAEIAATLIVVFTSTAWKSFSNVLIRVCHTSVECAITVLVFFFVTVFQIYAQRISEVRFVAVNLLAEVAGLWLLLFDDIVADKTRTLIFVVNWITRLCDYSFMFYNLEPSYCWQECEQIDFHHLIWKLFTV